MRIDLHLTSAGGARLTGFATWPGHPEPLGFEGVLELMALLEEVTRVDGANGG